MSPRVRPVRCRRCARDFSIALPSQADQRELAKIFSLDRDEFVGALREATLCSRENAEAIAAHVAGSSERCQGCGARIGPGLVVECASCRALNIQLGDPEACHPCAACGFVTLRAGYGSYDICPVCGWEDDCVQLANPTSGGGANGESLAEAQALALERVPLERMEWQGYRRDPAWRPLSADEIAEADRRRSVRHWHSGSVTSPSEVYWRLRHPSA